MKQLFTLLFLSFFAFNLSAQIVVEPGTLTTTIGEDDKKEISMVVTNTEQTSYDVYWRVIKSEDWPEEWGTTLCDDNLCYLENFDECPPSKPNPFVGNYSSSAWSLKFVPHGVKGSATLYIEFYSDNTYETVIGSTDPTAIVVADSDLISSTSEVFKSDIVLYPNPTQQNFRVKNDSEVATISLMNIIGKEVWTRSHVRGTQYDVSDLYKGMYIVRLINSKGKLIKSIRLNKTTI